MARVLHQAKRRLTDAKGIILASWGAALAMLSGRRPQHFSPGRIVGPYQGTAADALMQAVVDLDRTDDQLAAMNAAARALRTALDAGGFDRWLNDDAPADSKLMLAQSSDYRSGRRWKLQIFYIPEGSCHAPHSHTDVASCLMVAKGRLHTREYDRFRQLERDPRYAMLAYAGERQLERGDVLLTTMDKRDVHWFGAIGGPAIAFNFQAAGFQRGMSPLQGLRTYVDPTTVAPVGIHQAAMLSRSQARSRFHHRPLSSFEPTPSLPPEPVDSGRAQRDIELT